MATVKAQLNNVRLSPRKVRLVVNVVKGKNALKALEQLEFISRRPADPLVKLLKSALANAENNFNMVRSNLYIQEFYVDEGTKLKRYRPKAFGRAGEIQKKTSHVHLVLAEKVPGLKSDKKSVPKGRDLASGGHEHSHDHAEHDHGHEHKKTDQLKDHVKPEPNAPKPKIEEKLGKENKGAFASAKKKFFQRKSI